MEDIKQFKNVAVLPNTLGSGSWEISYCLKADVGVKLTPGPMLGSKWTPQTLLHDYF